MIAELHKGFKRYPDGREKCLPNSAGNTEYRRRRDFMYDRDKGICCVCSLKNIQQRRGYICSRQKQGARRWKPR